MPNGSTITQTEVKYCGQLIFFFKILTNNILIKAIKTNKFASTLKLICFAQ